MTFTIPADLAIESVRRVPARDRSRYIAEVLSARLREPEERIARACEIANRTADVSRIECEWDALAGSGDAVEQPWSDGPTR
jgi:ubiquinone biosynthesis protein UbiJ